MATLPMSPQKINKKQSLSILSASHVNCLNNTPAQDLKKERIVSESTGLIKFSIKKPTAEDSPERKQHAPTIPIFVPIDQDTVDAKPTENDLLFQMAAKQRQIMELKDQLKLAEQELSALEDQYNSQNIPTTPTRKQPISETIKKSTSILNFQQSPQTLSKTQTQISRGLSQLSSNFQSTSNGLLSKGRELWGTRIKKDIQLGQEMLSQMFDNNSSAHDSDDSSLIDDKQFEYSVDFDLDHLNNLNVESKLKGTLLQQLQEEDEEFDEDLRLSSDDEHDYGGHATPI